MRCDQCDWFVPGIAACRRDNTMTEDYESCESWKPITQATFIRHMSNEDLADLLSNTRCSECPLRYKCGGREEVDVAMCYKYWLRYMESDVAHGKMYCKCYRAERNFLGKVGVCFGTKERDPCSCGGDERKCNFYPDKTITLDRRKAFKFMLDDEDSQIQVIKDAKKYGLAIMKPMANGDSIRSMNDKDEEEK